MQSQLPPWLQDASRDALHGVSGKALTRDYGRLSAGYRFGKPEAKGAWLAYLAARMPATYAAVAAAFQQIPAELASGIQSLLDLGSGPGTACWAAVQAFPKLKMALGLEQDQAALDLAGSLAQKAPFKPSFVRAELQGPIQAEEADLVVAAYVANELEEAKREAFFEAAWSKAKKILVIVEPGTPLGFDSVLQARSRLLGLGAHLLAPCPHESACPLAGDTRSKWCHFSQRLERSKLAKLAKAGDLGYEDEKFSYVILSKPAWRLSGSRVMGRPKKLEKQVSLELCAPSGLSQLKLLKKDKPFYKAARKAEWGDLWGATQGAKDE